MTEIDIFREYLEAVHDGAMKRLDVVERMSKAESRGGRAGDYPSRLRAIAERLDLLQKPPEEHDVVCDCATELRAVAAEFELALAGADADAICKGSFTASHDFTRWECSRCGAISFTPFESLPPRYCSACNRRFIFNGDGHSRVQCGGDCCERTYGG